MKKKQTEDIVAGRLAGVSGPKARPKGLKRRLASYGSDRLGIASDADGEGPGSTTLDTPSLRVADLFHRAEAKAKPADPRARQADEAFERRFRFEPQMESLAPPVHEQLAHWDTVRSSRRQRGLLISAGVLGCLVIITVVMVATSGRDEPAAPIAPGPRKAVAAPTNRTADRQTVVQRQPGQPPAPPVIVPRLSPSPKPAIDPHAAADLLSPPDLLDKPPADAMGSDDSDAPAPPGRPALNFVTTRPAARPKPPATRPAIRYGPCPPGFRLSGIVRRGKADVAGINGRFVGVGDVVHGAKVLAIVGFSVEMELNGQRFLLGVAAPPPVEPEADADDDETDTSPPVDEGREKPKKKAPSDKTPTE